MFLPREKKSTREIYASGGGLHGVHERATLVRLLNIAFTRLVTHERTDGSVINMRPASLHWRRQFSKVT